MTVLVTFGTQQNLSFAEQHAHIKRISAFLSISQHNHVGSTNQRLLDSALVHLQHSTVSHSTQDSICTQGSHSCVAARGVRSAPPTLDSSSCSRQRQNPAPGAAALELASANRARRGKRVKRLLSQSPRQRRRKGNLRVTRRSTTQRSWSRAGTSLPPSGGFGSDDSCMQHSKHIFTHVVVFLQGGVEMAHTIRCEKAPPNLHLLMSEHLSPKQHTCDSSLGSRVCDAQGLPGNISRLPRCQ